MRTSADVADFDSSAAMFRALARFLHGKDLRAMGMVSPTTAALLEPVIGALNVLPRRVLDRIYFTGSARVADFLRQRGSYRTRWDPPPPDGRSPEAEWGFEAALMEHLEPLARRRGWRLRRIVFEEPEHLSPLVADLHRWWYGRRGIRPARLLVETFIALDLWWTLRTGSVPFWLKFPVEPDAAWLARYLETTEPYDEIGLTLFCHGVESAGWVPAEAWRRLLGAHARELRFLGANERVYPRDFASFARLRPALKALPSRHPMPAPLTLAQLDRFLDEFGDRYPVTVEPLPAAPKRARGAA